MIGRADRMILERVNNCRDFGGVGTMDGSRVAAGRLLRSAHGNRASADDLAMLRNLGLSTVVDLRRPGERMEQPSAWLGRWDLAVIDSGGQAPDVEPELPPHITALLASRTAPGRMGEYLEAIYAELPYQRAYVDLFARYFAALPTLQGSILIHCSAGKDRTGILAALTLNLLGVHRDDIMHDYMLTNEISSIADRLPRFKARLAAQHAFEPDDAALATLLRVEPTYLSRMYSAIAERSGSVDRYLETVLGVAPAVRARIVANLVI